MSTASAVRCWISSRRIQTASTPSRKSLPASLRIKARSGTVRSIPITISATNCVPTTLRTLILKPYLSSRRHYRNHCCNRMTAFCVLYLQLLPIRVLHSHCTQKAVSVSPRRSKQRKMPPPIMSSPSKVCAEKTGFFLCPPI